MTATPPTLLNACVNSRLLRPVCPRRVPAADEPHTQIRRLGSCTDARGHDLVINGHYALLDSSRCVQAVWGFEAVGWPPGYLSGKPATVSGWDPATRMLAPSESGLISPPVHIHIEVEASTLTPTRSELGGDAAAGYRAASDALLSAKRTRPVSLGWVRWSGHYGQLLLDPVFPSGSEWGGHLIFYFTAGQTHYAVTLHAWLPAIRIHQGSARWTVIFQTGPALPHVIATLKTMLGSVQQLGHRSCSSAAAGSDATARACS